VLVVLLLRGLVLLAVGVVVVEALALVGFPIPRFSAGFRILPAKHTRGSQRIRVGW